MTTKTTQEAGRIAVSRDDLAEALTEFYLTVRYGSHACKGQVSDPGEVADALHATLSRVAAERGPDDELRKLREGARELGHITARLYRVMEAARIEVHRGNPGEAMQWILGALPPPVDEGDGLGWDGQETAQAWFDRVEAADAEAEAGAQL